MRVLETQVHIPIRSDQSDRSVTGLLIIVRILRLQLWMQTVFGVKGKVKGHHHALLPDAQF